MNPISLLLSFSSMPRVSLLKICFQTYLNVSNNCAALATTTWNKGLSDFGDKQKDWDALGEDARSTFETFIFKWLNLMSTKNENILGYSAHPDSSDCRL